MTPFWKWQGDTLILHCQIQARADRDEIVGEHGGRLRVRVRAVPAEGAANQRLRRFLAGEFAVAPAGVELLSGHGHRYKTVHVLSPARLPGCLAHIRGMNGTRQTASAVPGSGYGS